MGAHASPAATAKDRPHRPGVGEVRREHDNLGIAMNKDAAVVADQGIGNEAFSFAVNRTR